MENFLDHAKVYRYDTDWGPISRVDWCGGFEKKLWFDLGKIMWKNCCSIFQDHVKYIHNYIVNTFRVVIIQYAEIIRDIRDLYIFLPPSSKKGDKYDMAYCTVRDK